MTHSVRPDPEIATWGATNSKNFAGNALSRLTGTADFVMRFSLAYSKRKIVAVRKTPCSRAAPAADPHMLSESANGLGANSANARSAGKFSACRLEHQALSCES
jgi:hypothetical protein